MNEKIEKLRNEYAVKVTVLRIMRDDVSTDRHNFKRLNAKMGCYNTFIYELDKILKS